MNTIQTIIILILFFFAIIEIRHKARPYSPIKIKVKSYSIERSINKLIIHLNLKITNPHKRMEVMIPSLKVKPIIFGHNFNNQVISDILINNISSYPYDIYNHWQSCIVKANDSLAFSTDIIISSNTEISLNDIWLLFDWVNYGPFGIIREKFGFTIPIEKPKKLNSTKALSYKFDSCQVLPIKTHILGILDDPYELLENYLSEIKLRDTDIITIGETPLAIMQGRYTYPSNIQISSLAKFLCQGFHPTSSLATACGMQSLIDIVGPSRVITAWMIGAFMKLLGLKGFFYRLAGDQARLIDDITGTTPPYDKSIVLGPTSVRLFCELASKRLGINVAVVDVNDLGKVKILASSKKTNIECLEKALRSNPAGNANEQTPLVLIRP